MSFYYNIMYAKKYLVSLGECFISYIDWDHDVKWGLFKSCYMYLLVFSPYYYEIYFLKIKNLLTPELKLFGLYKKYKSPF